MKRAISLLIGLITSLFLVSTAYACDKCGCSAGGHAAHGTSHAVQTAAAAPAADGTEKAVTTAAYPVDACPVSGQKLGSMGDPVVKTYDGREVQLCCAGCVDKFEADKAGYFKTLDEAIITAQKDSYPLETCVVSDEKLGGMGEPANYVYQNQLVRFCCAGCIGAFEKEPAKYMAKLHGGAHGEKHEESHEQHQH